MLHQRACKLFKRGVPSALALRERVWTVRERSGLYQLNTSDTQQESVYTQFKHQYAMCAMSSKAVWVYRLNTQLK